jgi:hypothetical protein
MNTRARAPGTPCLAVALAGLALAGCRVAHPEPAHGPQPPPATLVEAQERWRLAPADEDAIVWLGRRTAYEGRLEEAIGIYDEGLRLHPASVRLLRHRGHRWLSLRQPLRARADLERAAALIAGHPDEVELDGLPNAFGIPRSTLHTNVWYHLGLACHLLGDDAAAADAFARCYALSPNDDMRVASAWWRALALFHLGRCDEAGRLAAFHAGRSLDLMESFDYARLLRLVGAGDEEALVSWEAAEDPIAAATLGYGVAMWQRWKGDEEAARATLQRLVAAPPSTAFGRLAAEVELGRLAPGQ